MSSPSPGTPCGPKKIRGPCGSSIISVKRRPLLSVVDWRMNGDGINIDQNPCLFGALPPAIRSAHPGGARCETSFL